jgi:hypothetical protein
MRWTNGAAETTISDWLKRKQIASIGNRQHADHET